MRELVAVATRRAIAFLRFGLDGLEARDGGDFVIPAICRYQFWPEDVSPQDRELAREEYRAWLAGSCLRELDQFYGLFLDKVWWAVEVAILHGTMVPSDFKFDAKFAKDTNVARKQRKVAGILEAADHYEELNSLSLARNALTHNAGVVRSPNDCNTPDRTALEIKWLAFDMLAIRGGEERVVTGFPFDTKDIPGDGGTEIAARLSARALRFTAGTRIVLNPPQLAEICFFYGVVTEKLLEALSNHYRAKGIPVSTSA